jgi:alpha-1,6-mannosyltransferase
VDLVTAQTVTQPGRATHDTIPSALSGMPVALWLLAGLFLVVTAFGAWQMAFYEHDRLFALMLAQGILYLAAAWWILRHDAVLDRWPVVTVLLGAGLLARAMLLPMPPVSTDVYRYVWDGRVQSAGINPYRYMPANPDLTALRDEAVYPRINRVDTAVTIYPPMAQIVFLAASKLGDSVLAMKAMMVAFEALAVFALLRLLKARGQSRARILFYAWHPLPLFEFAGSGHVDAIAIGLMLAAMLAANSKRPFLSGMLLAAGTAAKYVPAVIGPALYRRWDWRMPAGFALALLLLYLPYLGVGRGILGFLPGYVEEEGIADSGIFWIALFQRLTGTQANLSIAYLCLVALVLTSLGLVALFRRCPERVSPLLAGALLLTFTLAVTPHYAWYFSWLVPLLCSRPSIAVLWLTLAAPALYGLPWLPDAFVVQVAIYLPALALILFDVLRTRSSPAAERALS